jgi:hypothetical protein
VVLPLGVYLAGSEGVVADLAVAHVIVRRQPHRRPVSFDQPPPLRSTLRAAQTQAEEAELTSRITVTRTHMSR